jgi:hypothetical protein
MRIRASRLWLVLTGLFAGCSAAMAIEFELPKLHPRLRFILPDDFLQRDLAPVGYKFLPVDDSAHGALSVQLLPALRMNAEQWVPPVTDDTSPTLTVGKRELRWQVRKPDAKREKYSYSAAVRASELNIRFPTGGDAYLVLNAYADTQEAAEKLWRLFEKLNLPPKPE